MTEVACLSRLTLVVPTYKRQDFALRLMDYWAGKGPEIIVLDGSPDPIAPVALAKYPQSIRYFHKPIGLYERLFASLDLIETEFVALAADDEFYIPSAAAKCIKELDHEPALVACCGRAIGFSCKSNSVMGKPVYPALADYSVDADNAEERLIQHMREYVPSLVYAVCRTDVWRKSFGYTLRNEFPFFAAGELQFEMLMSYAGKSKVTPELMWLRALGENVPTRGTDPSLDPAKTIPDWWANSAYSDEHEKFLTIMAEGFSTFSNQSKEFNEYRKSVVKGIEVYLDCCEVHLNRSAAYLLRGIARRLVPERCKQPIKQVLYMVRLKKDFSNTSLIDGAKSLEVTGVYVDYDELKNIESIIMNFHQNRADQKSVASI